MQELEGLPRSSVHYNISRTHVSSKSKNMTRIGNRRQYFWACCQSCTMTLHLEVSARKIAYTRAFVGFQIHVPRHSERVGNVVNKKTCERENPCSFFSRKAEHGSYIRKSKFYSSKYTITHNTKIF